MAKVRPCLLLGQVPFPPLPPSCNACPLKGLGLDWDIFSVHHHLQLMPRPQSCHLEEGGENGEAVEEEVEVSFEVGGIK